MERRTKRRRTYFTLGEMVAFGDYILNRIYKLNSDKGSVIWIEEVDKIIEDWRDQNKSKTTKDVLKDMMLTNPETLKKNL